MEVKGDLGVCMYSACAPGCTVTDCLRAQEQGYNSVCSQPCFVRDTQGGLRVRICSRPRSFLCLMKPSNIMCGTSWQHELRVAGACLDVVPNQVSQQKRLHHV